MAGASGAGKSTLLRALAGLLDAVDPGDVHGEVLVDGTPVRPGDGHVGLLLQDPADARVAGTVLRDVAFGPENLGLSRSDIHERVHWALAEVGFPYGPAHATAALSGGEAQRLALAGVLALRPGLLLLDEPTGMLDDEAAAGVRAAVVSASARSGASVVVVEHRLGPWVEHMDRLVVLGVGGQVVADGPVRRVLAERAADLLAAGVWVPGAPPPEPLGVPADVVAPWGGASVPRGESLVAGRDLRVVRRPPRGLRVVRSPEPAVTALDGVAATVRSGRLLTLRGSSGAGKSTLLSLLCGLEAPSGGQVTALPSYAGEAGPNPARWRSAEVAARVGWVPQRAELTITTADSVRACLEATPRALGRSGAAMAHRIDALLQVLGLDGLATQNPYHLSGGELRRLAVAGALAHGPGLVGLDEPTVGQDRRTWSAVAGLVLAARDAGAGVVAGTHDADLAAYADDVLCLERGRAVVA